MTEIDTSYGYKLTFPACNAFAKTVIRGLIGCLLYDQHWTLLLIKELTSQQMKCDQGPMLIEFNGLTMFPIILEQLP